GADRPEGAADGIGGGRLQVPGVELARAADEEEEDAVDVAAVCGPHAVQVGQGQADGAGAEAAHAQEVPPRQAVTEAGAPGAVEAQHDPSPKSGRSSGSHRSGPGQRCNRKVAGPARSGTMMTLRQDAVLVARTPTMPFTNLGLHTSLVQAT